VTHALERIVVLGHRGFIGRAIVERLGSRFPEAEVIGRSSAELDLTSSKSGDALAALLGPETAVVLCSAIKRQSGDSVDSYDANMQMAVNVCRAMQTNAPRRLLFLSSTAVYGEDIGNLAITEATPPNLRSYYGLAKWSSELLFEKVSAGLPSTGLVRLRPPTVYGPGEKVISYGVGSFLKEAAAGGPIKLWGDGSELRELMFIDDVAEIVARFVDHPFTGAVNVVAGKSYTFQDALAAVLAATGRDLPTESRARSKDKVDNAFDNSLLRTLLPDIRFTPLTEGVRRTAAAQAGKAAA
jgi:UDP-glucose 4-epimerase